MLQQVRNSSATMIFYEAPHRAIEAVEDIVEILGGKRHIVVAREMTKLHEEFLRGPTAEVLQNLKSRDAVKGEITLLIAKADVVESTALQTPILNMRERVQQIMSQDQIDEKAALKKAAKERRISKSEAYRQMQREK